MQLADTFMVAGLGAPALAAIAPAGLAVFAIAVVGTGVLTIPHTSMGRAYGAEELSRCRSLAWQGVWAAGLLGIAALLFVPTAEQVAAAFGHAPRTAKYEATYIRIGLLGLLPQFIGTACANYFLATLRPKVVMIAVLCTIALNVALNYLLINGHWGCPKLGFAGAAWGTVFASTFYALLMVTMLWAAHRRQESTSSSEKRPRKSSIARIFRDGLPIGVQDSVEAICWGLLVVVLAGRYGDAHGAAASVLIRCIQLSFLPVEGVGMGLMSLVANAVGGGDHQRAKRQTQIAFRLAAGYMTSMALIFFILRRPIMELFTSDPTIIAIGMQAMICVCLFQLFDAMAITHIFALFGAGDSAWPSIVNILLGLFVLLGGALLLGKMAPHLESFGVWIAAAAYIMAQGLALRWRWARGKWQGLPPQAHP